MNGLVAFQGTAEIELMSGQLLVGKNDIEKAKQATYSPNSIFTLKGVSVIMASNLTLTICHSFINCDKNNLNYISVGLAALVRTVILFVVF